MNNPKKKTWKQKAAAFAVACSLCAGGIGVKEARAGCCGETAVLFAILAAMEIDFELLYIYMISGLGDTGTGIVGTISGNARAKMSHDEVQGGNQAAHYAAVDRERTGEFIAAKNNNLTIGDPRQCAESVIADSYGARGANTAAAAISATAAAASSTKAAEHQAGTQPSDSSHAAVVIQEMTKYASPADVTAGRATSASATMPDANVRAQSLFVPAHDYTSATEAAKQSLTFNPEQVTAAQLAVDNLAARFSPPALPQGVEATPAGKMYIAKTKIFNARVSPAVMALSGIAARRSPATLDGANQQAWQKASSEYSDIFPGVQLPDKPSELELLRIEVMRRFAGSDWIASLKRSNNPTDVAIEQAVTDSVKLKLLYEIHTRLEENSAIQAAILAQLVNPVSRNEIEAAGQNAFRNKQGN